MADLMIKENNRIVDQVLINQKEGFEVSSKYVAISTQEVLDEIKVYTGLEPSVIGFNKRNVRKAGKQGFQGHVIMAEMPNSEMVDGTRMNMILFNSNDRSSSLKIHLGALRAACSNQLVWGEELFEPLSIRHSQKDWKQSIYTLMDAYEETQKETQEMIEMMMKTYVSYGDIGRMVERVSEEILEPSIVGSVLDPLQLNIAHRKEDTGKTLWNTYNRIQYNLLQGGVDRIIEKTEEDVLFETISATHIVSDTKKQIEFNKQLHTIVMESAR